MLSTRVKNPLITILFYFCVIEVNLSFKPLDEQSILMKLLQFEFFIISFVYLANDWGHLFSHFPTTKICEVL